MYDDVELYIIRYVCFIIRYQIIHHQFNTVSRNMTNILQLKPGVSKIIHSILMCYNFFNADFFISDHKTYFDLNKNRESRAFSIRKKTKKEMRK